MVCTLSIQSAWTIWDEPMKKAYINEIKFGSYLLKPIYTHIPTYLSTCLAYTKLPILT
jgi:hypothetical protein